MVLILDHVAAGKQQIMHGSEFKCKYMSCLPTLGNAVAAQQAGVGCAAAAAPAVGLTQAAADALHTLLPGTADVGPTGSGTCCCTLTKQALLALVAAPAAAHNAG
jgi:hypothetical protein